MSTTPSDLTAPVRQEIVSAAKPQHHGFEYAVKLTVSIPILAIRGWLNTTMDAIERQRVACMRLPGTAEKLT